MHTVASIASVTSPSGASPAYRVVTQGVPVGPAQPAKNNGVVRQSKGPSSVQSAQPAAQKTLPLGLLQSVNQPAGNNFEATLDYHDLRMALQSGNLTVAQQAYLRLQTDLLMAGPTAGTPTTNNGHLNLTG